MFIFYYVIYVVSFVQETLEKHLSSCQNVWFCYCTDLCFPYKTMYLWSMRSPGVGNCLFLRARGWGKDSQLRTKLQIPGGVPGGDGNR